jgi:hypothetical protein
VPWFLPALYAGATLALARKIVARYWHGVHGQHAQADPPGLRTVARFDGEPRKILRAVADELARDLGPLEVTKDAIRAEIDGTRVDIVRLRSPNTVELTRAWTGVYLGDQCRQLLQRMHDALAEHAVTWFARQDRELVEAHPVPFDSLAIAR